MPEKSQPKYTVSHTVDEFGNARWNVEDEKANWIGSPFDYQEAAQMAADALNRGLITPDELN